jgi:hypothetical protein
MWVTLCSEDSTTSSGHAAVLMKFAGKMIFLSRMQDLSSMLHTIFSQIILISLLFKGITSKSTCVQEFGYCWVTVDALPFGRIMSPSPCLQNSISCQINFSLPITKEISNLRVCKILFPIISLLFHVYVEG